MKEELLKRIREESQVKISRLNEDNEYARNRAALEEQEEIKKMLGLPYNRSIGPVEKTEEDIIMEVYKQYASQIEEIDTHGIFVYDSTYMALDLTLEMIEEGYPLQVEVDMNDPRATHRYYYNLEGLFAECVNIEDIAEFEKENIVIYVENPSMLERNFIVSAVREGQEKAIQMVLKNRTK